MAGGFFTSSVAVQHHKAAGEDAGRASGSSVGGGYDEQLKYRKVIWPEDKHDNNNSEDFATPPSRPRSSAFSDIQDENPKVDRPMAWIKGVSQERDVDADTNMGKWDYDADINMGKWDADEMEIAKRAWDARMSHRVRTSASPSSVRRRAASFERQPAKSTFPNNIRHSNKKWESASALDGSDSLGYATWYRKDPADKTMTTITGYQPQRWLPTKQEKKLEYLSLTRDQVVDHLSEEAAKIQQQQQRRAPLVYSFAEEYGRLPRQQQGPGHQQMNAKAENGASFSSSFYRQQQQQQHEITSTSTSDGGVFRAMPARIDDSAVTQQQQQQRQQQQQIWKREESMRQRQQQQQEAWKTKEINTQQQHYQQEAWSTKEVRKQQQQQQKQVWNKEEVTKRQQQHQEARKTDETMSQQRFNQDMSNRNETATRQRQQQQQQQHQQQQSLEEQRRRYDEEKRRYEELRRREEEARREQERLERQMQNIMSSRYTRQQEQVRKVSTPVKPTPAEEDKRGGIALLQNRSVGKSQDNMNFGSTRQQQQVREEVKAPVKPKEESVLAPGSQGNKSGGIVHQQRNVGQVTQRRQAFAARTSRSQEEEQVASSPGVLGRPRRRWLGEQDWIRRQTWQQKQQEEEGQSHSRPASRGAVRAAVDGFASLSKSRSNTSIVDGDDDGEGRWRRSRSRSQGRSMSAFEWRHRRGDAEASGPRFDGVQTNQVSDTISKWSRMSASRENLNSATPTAAGRKSATPSRNIGHAFADSRINAPPHANIAESKIRTHPSLDIAEVAVTNTGDKFGKSDEQVQKSEKNFGKPEEKFGKSQEGPKTPESKVEGTEQIEVVTSSSKLELVDVNNETLAKQPLTSTQKELLFDATKPRFSPVDDANKKHEDGLRLVRPQQFVPKTPAPSLISQTKTNIIQKDTRLETRTQNGMESKLTVKETPKPIVGIRAPPEALRPTEKQNGPNAARNATWQPKSNQSKDSNNNNHEIVNSNKMANAAMVTPSITSWEMNNSKSSSGSKNVNGLPMPVEQSWFDGQKEGARTKSSSKTEVPAVKTEVSTVPTPTAKGKDGKATPIPVLAGWFGEEEERQGRKKEEEDVKKASSTEKMTHVESNVKVSETSKSVETRQNGSLDRISKPEAGSGLTTKADFSPGPEVKSHNNLDDANERRVNNKFKTVFLSKGAESKEREEAERERRRRELEEIANAREKANWDDDGGKDKEQEKKERRVELEEVARVRGKSNWSEQIGWAKTEADEAKRAREEELREVARRRGRIQWEEEAAAGKLAAEEAKEARMRELQELTTSRSVKLEGEESDEGSAGTAKAIRDARAKELQELATARSVGMMEEDGGASSAQAAKTIRDARAKELGEMAKMRSEWSKAQEEETKSESQKEARQEELKQVAERRGRIHWEEEAASSKLAAEEAKEARMKELQELTTVRSIKMSNDEDGASAAQTANAIKDARAKELGETAKLRKEASHEGNMEDLSSKRKLEEARGARRKELTEVAAARAQINWDEEVAAAVAAEEAADGRERAAPNAVHAPTRRIAAALAPAQPATANRRAEDEWEEIETFMQRSQEAILQSVEDLGRRNQGNPPSSSGGVPSSSGGPPKRPPPPPPPPGRQSSREFMSHDAKR